MICIKAKVAKPLNFITSILSFDHLIAPLVVVEFSHSKFRQGRLQR